MIHTLTLFNKQIHFVWIPGHIEITGNETADSATSLAAASHIPEDNPVRPDRPQNISKKQNQRLLATTMECIQRLFEKLQNNGYCMEAAF